MTCSRLCLFLALAPVSSSLAQVCEYPIVDLRKCPRRTARVPHIPKTNGCGPEGSIIKFPQGYANVDFVPGATNTTFATRPVTPTKRPATAPSGWNSSVRAVASTRSPQEAETIRRGIDAPFV